MCDYKHLIKHISRLVRQCLLVILISFSMVFASPVVQAKPLQQAMPIPHRHSAATEIALNHFIQQVLSTNPTLQAAQARVFAAEARARAADQPLYNPELTAEDQQATDRTYAVGVNQTIDWTNKRHARAQVGLSDIQIAQAQLADVRLTLTTQILDALARYQAAENVVGLAKQRTTLLKQLVALTQKQHATGDIARVDVDLAQLALSEALAQQAEAEVTQSQALETLQAITNSKQFAWPSLPHQLPSATLTKIDVEKQVNALPSVQVITNEYLSANARIQLARRERYPDPTIGVQGGREHTDEGSSRLVGVTVSMPLYVRNSYRAEVDAANNEAIEAGEKREALRWQARATMQSQAEQYVALYQAVQAWQQTSGQPLKDGISLLERLWQAGEINTTDYIVQVKQHIDSQIAGQTLQGQAWQAWFTWLKASGTLNQWLNHTAVIQHKDNIQ